MPTDEQYVALPKLYGAPQYSRPRVQVPQRPRPFDPDEMPIAAAQTADEQALYGSLPSHAFAAGGGVFLEDVHVDRLAVFTRRMLRPRPFLLRALINRLLSRQDDIDTDTDSELPPDDGTAPV